MTPLLQLILFLLDHFDEEEDTKVKESIDIGELSNFLLEERWTEDNYDSLAMAGVRLERPSASASRMRPLRRN